MSASPGGGLIPELRERPTSVFIHGMSRPLLNWVLYAILVRSDPDYAWTDVRFSGEALDPLDPIARGVVPERQLSVIEPTQLRRERTPPRLPPSMIRADDSPAALERLADFLGLPEHTQEMIARVRAQRQLPLLGLSNCHRLAGAMPTEMVEPTLRTILRSGVSLVLTWADAEPGGSSSFDFVLGIEGSSPAQWRDAKLRCTLGLSHGEIRAGRTFRLAELPPISEVLDEALPTRR